MDRRVDAGSAPRRAQGVVPLAGQGNSAGPDRGHLHRFARPDDGSSGSSISWQSSDWGRFVANVFPDLAASGL